MYCNTLCVCNTLLTRSVYRVHIDSTQTHILEEIRKVIRMANSTTQQHLRKPTHFPFFKLPQVVFEPTTSLYQQSYRGSYLIYVHRCTYIRTYLLDCWFEISRVTTDHKIEVGPANCCKSTSAFLICLVRADVMKVTASLHCSADGTSLSSNADIWTYF